MCFILLLVDSWFHSTCLRLRVFHSDTCDALRGTDWWLVWACLFLFYLWFCVIQVLSYLVRGFG